MEMKRLGDLFERYQKRLVPPQASVEKVVVETIKEQFNFDVSQDRCSYNTTTKTAHLSIPGVLKTEIFLQKNQLLENLKRRLGKNAPTQIL